ncbi:MAG TPA: 50S ribosomal protein L24 [Candidatus Paceibacterota bacterium]|nr:50S ribosomal protein L24 [Candidatus Paceibacterota bacterium]
MHVKKGDNVIIITGKDKGKTGKIVKALPAFDKVVVEGINLRKKHVRAKKSGAKGEVVEMAHPLHVSNVKLAEAPKKKAAAKAKAK